MKNKETLKTIGLVLACGLGVFAFVELWSKASPKEKGTFVSALDILKKLTDNSPNAGLQAI